jgi:hypothetical protein
MLGNLCTWRSSPAAGLCSEKKLARESACVSKRELARESACVSERELARESACLSEREIAREGVCKSGADLGEGFDEARKVVLQQLFVQVVQMKLGHRVLGFRIEGSGAL